MAFLLVTNPQNEEGLRAVCNSIDVDICSDQRVPPNFAYMAPWDQNLADQIDANIYDLELIPMPDGEAS